MLLTVWRFDRLLSLRVYSPHKSAGHTCQELRQAFGVLSFHGRVYTLAPHVLANAAQSTILRAKIKEVVTRFLPRSLALWMHIWILSGHRFTARSGDEAVICGHENKRWQAMSD